MLIAARPSACCPSCRGAVTSRQAEPESWWRRVTRLFVSAAAKSSGKTTITLGLAAAFSARGLKVQTFKKGPDYIDPMWLARASGRASYNLDFNTQRPAEILAVYAREYRRRRYRPDRRQQGPA